VVGYLERLGITQIELEQILASSASLRGILVGYLAEVRLMETWFRDYPPKKYDDHDRKHKGDRWISYKGREISIEVKSLQSGSVEQIGDDQWTGAVQIDASDRRPVVLPNGDRLETVCLVVGGFDLVAVNLFEFGGKWRFAFARNCDLPRSTFRKYTPEQRQFLLQTTPKITWPPQPPFREEPFALMDAIVVEALLDEMAAED
jgi:hypothetical protein